jgi:hypothetical protein
LFLMMASLTGVRWNLSEVLICISFMARDCEHFFMCFLAIWISSFEKVLFSSVAHFFIGSLILGEFIFLSSLHILVISLLSNVKLANIFSHSVSGQFSLEIISCVEQKLFSFMRSHSSIYLLIAELLGFHWESPFLYLLVPKYFLLFPVPTLEFGVWY